MQYALEHGIIDLAYVQEQVEMNKRKELLEKHPYEIWCGKDGFWHTYLPDGVKGRKSVKRKEKARVEDAIVSYWKQEEENPTVKALFQEWIDGKVSRNEVSLSTKERYENQYAECMTEFGKHRVRSIDECDIQDFLLNAIHEHHLTSKGYSNLKTLIYGIFRRAKAKRLISYSIVNVISDMEIPRKAFRRDAKPDEDLVFSEEETEIIVKYIESNPFDMLNLGILLAFKTGVRPGELSAIKKEDIDSTGISIHRTEIYYKTDDGERICEVRDFPKTEAGIRTVVVPRSCQWILKMLNNMNPTGEYVFEQNGERIKTAAFARRIDYLCKKLNLKHRSLNKIRKTYASILMDGGVPASLVISQMGHTDIKTTQKHYYKNRKSMQEREKVINNIAEL